MMCDEDMPTASPMLFACYDCIWSGEQGLAFFVLGLLLGAVTILFERWWSRRKR